MKNSGAKYEVSTPVTTATTKSSRGLCIGIIVGVVLLIVVGVGLGVGLGLGLKKTGSSSTSTAPPTSVTTDVCQASTATCGCPTVQPSISSRIVNANVSTPNSWPWMVAIYIDNGRFCGGTLIDYQHVLTAAHCVFDVNSTSIVIYAGIHQLSQRDTGEMRNITSITVHPNYSDALKLNDLAVLKLSSPLNKTPSVGLCCLSTMNSTPAISDMPIFVGWGRTAPMSNFSDELRQAAVRVVDPLLCNFTSVSDSKLCAGETSSVACYGDSGSPLMMKINNLWTCVGLVNWGLMTCDSYVAYTKVAYHYGFISDAMGI